MSGAELGGHIDVLPLWEVVLVLGAVAAAEAGLLILFGRFLRGRTVR